MISELCHFLEFKKPPYSVKQGFEERIDQVVSIFDSSFFVYGFTHLLFVHEFLKAC